MEFLTNPLNLVIFFPLVGVLVYAYLHGRQADTADEAPPADEATPLDGDSSA